MQSRLAATIGVAFVTGIASLPPAVAQTALSLQSSNSTVNTGASFQLGVQIDQALDVYAFEFDLRYDPALVSAGALAEGGFLASGGTTVFIPGMVDPAAGVIAFTAASLLGPVSGVGGSGRLATFTFSGTHAGMAAFSLENVTLLDATLSPVVPSLQGASVQVLAVPEPDAVYLLAGGLVALWLHSRTRAATIAVACRQTKP